MTNRQWLMEQMQNMSDEEFAEIFEDNTYICDIKKCEAKTNEHCENCTINWLKAEHKELIKLSDVERVVLENSSKDYKWIAREYDGTIVIYAKKPTRDINCGCWDTDNEIWCCFEAFNHLFQFIKWEDPEPYNIEELLKGE